MTGDAQHCSFVLLADFDIDRGAQLTYQFPQPLGTDEGYVPLSFSSSFLWLILSVRLRWYYVYLYYVTGYLPI